MSKADDDDDDKTGRFRKAQEGCRRPTVSAPHTNSLPRARTPRTALRRSRRTRRDDARKATKTDLDRGDTRGELIFFCFQKTKPPPPKPLHGVPRTNDATPSERVFACDQGEAHRRIRHVPVEMRRAPQLRRCSDPQQPLFRTVCRPGDARARASEDVRKALGGSPRTSTPKGGSRTCSEAVEEAGGARCPACS